MTSILHPRYSTFSPRTLLDLLHHRAAFQMEAPAYTFLADGENEEITLTYGTLGTRAQAIAALLQQYAKPGERILLLYPQGLDYLAGFFGCIYAGMIAIPAHLPESNPKKAASLRIQAILKDARPALALTTARYLSKCERALRDLEQREIQVIATDAQEVASAGGWQRPDISPEDLAFLQYTSGSTSTPRGVMVSHANVLSNHRMIQAAIQHPGEAAFVSWLPLFHDMGLISIALLALYLGSPCILLSPPAFLQKPLRWLRAISRYRAHTSGAPNFAYDLCARRITPEEGAGLDLSCWQLAFSGAEPVRSEVMQRFLAAFAPYGFRKEAFFPSYGLAEATVFATAGTKATAPVTSPLPESQQGKVSPGTGELVGCGRPWLDEKVYIVDPQSRIRCSEGEIGEIWIAGPHVAQGYWRRPEETEATFRASLADSGEGPFLRTGDLGFIQNNHLFITGRLKDLMIIRGVNYYPQDIEVTVEGSHPIVVPWACIAFSLPIQGEERLVVVQEVGRHASEQEMEEAIRCIRQRISDLHGLHVYTVLLVRVGSLPKTTSGKVQRQACKARFLEDSLEVVARKTWEEEEQKSSQGYEGVMAQMLRLLPEAGRLQFLQTYLHVQFARFSGQDQAAIESQQVASAIISDSLAATECCYQIEKDLGLALPLNELMGDRTIADLAQYLLERLKETDGKNLSGLRSVTPEHHTFPLSAMQRGLWFLHQLTPESNEYHLSFSVRFKGRLNLSALENSLKELLQRHALLRARILNRNDEPVIAIREEMPLDLSVESLEHLTPEAREAYARQYAESEARRPFRLETEPLVRFHLLKLEEKDSLLLMNIHHLIFDGWSLGIFLQELLAGYRAWENGRRPVFPELPVQYGDYVAWQRAWLDSEDCDTQLAYWRRRLEQAPVLLNLPTDYPRPAIQTAYGSSVAFQIEKDLTTKLKALARTEQTTLFTTLLAAFQILLFRYSGQADLIVGVPTAGRMHRELEGLIGLFVNTLAIRTDFSQHPDIRAFLQQVKRTMLEAYAHQEVPFELIVETLQPARQLSHTPIFQAMFTMQNVPLTSLETEGLVVIPSEVLNGGAQFDISLSMLETPGGIQGRFEYKTALFEHATIQRMSEHFLRLLAAMVQNPDTSVSSLAFLTPEEERWLLADHSRSDETGALAQQIPLHELISQQVRRTPQAIAIVDSRQRMTYLELERRAAELARRLRARGVGPEMRVGVCMERGAGLVVALLGIFKAGGVYVPLDVSYPAERLAFMISDARITLLLTSSETHNMLFAHEVPRLNCDELDWQAAATDGVSEQERELAVDVHQLAYLIYTSGSTGRPKGVAIEHRAAWTLLHWARKTFSRQELAGVLAMTSHCFDLSIFELLAPLAWGGATVIVRDLWQFMEQGADWPITLINAVPSAMSQILAARALPESVETVTLAGEALTRDLVQQLYRFPSVRRVYNLYGPSEDTTYSTWSLVSRDDSRGPAIGIPVLRTRCYVLDQKLQLVPQGTIGELYLAGDGLARGYLERPDLTAERFLPNPWAAAPGERMYKTGDLVRYRLNGELEYLGRNDQQVKVRGYRIELGEIEAALRQHEQVQEAVVVAREDTPGDRRLVAYVVFREGGESALAGLHRFLQERLPAYMLPAAWVVLKHIPLTPNGKIDRNALPQPLDERAALGNAEVGPRTPTEKAIVSIWQDVLKLKSVGIFDNFFELGGHSLLATSVISRLRAEFQQEIPLSTLFLAPTVAQLAEYVEQPARETSPLPPIPRLPAAPSYPLSTAQQGIWFLEQLAPNSLRYTMSFALRLTGALNVAKLARSLSEIVRRHDTLRTLFGIEEGRPVQRIMPASEWVLTPEDISSEDEYERIKDQQAHQPFDLQHGPLLRVRLLRLSDTQQILLLNLHHLIADGWSMSIFAQELAALYEGWPEGQPSPLPALPARYVDYAAWQRQYVRDQVFEPQLAYWKQQLAGIPEKLDLPLDHPRPAVQTYNGTQQIFLYPPDLLQSLKEMSQREGVTLFMTLLTAFTILLMRYSGQEDIVVGSPIAGRTRPEAEEMIGLFINTLALRCDLSGNPAVRELLQRVRQTTLDAYAHQDLPFDQVVEAVQPKRSISHSPLFQVVMALQNVPMPPMEFAGITLTPMDVILRTAKYDLIFSFVELPNGLKTIVEYNTDLFDAETIERMAMHLRALLEQIAGEAHDRIWDLSLLSEQEQRQLLAYTSAAGSCEPEFLCLSDLFEIQVNRTPDEVALVYEGEKLTYRQLQQRADRLALVLRSRGVGPGTLVGLCLDRTADLVLGLLAVLRAGGAFVPLDISEPAARLAYVLNDTQLALVLAHQPTLTILTDLLAEYRTAVACVQALDDSPRPPALPGDIAYFDRGEQPPVESQGIREARKPALADLVYIMYTSGSTGRPKGVAITYENLAYFFAWTRRFFHLRPGDRVIQYHSLSFDFSIWEIFETWLAGATLYLVAQSVARDVEALSQAIRDWRINVLNMTPSQFTTLLDYVQHYCPHHLDSLHTLVLGGEALTPSLAERARAHLPARCAIYNEYGPTEATISCSICPIDQSAIEAAAGRGSVSIGTPRADMRLYVLDKHLRPVPRGVIGELYIGGEGLGWGYWQRPELTAERFLPDPLSEKAGARLYKTGDLACWLANGTLQFLGRVDYQVKLRGYRVEPGEIEAILSQHPVVRECAVQVREDGADEKQLVAYVVCRSDAGADADETYDAQIGLWRQIFDQTYHDAGRQQDPTFNIIGWNSSYTDQPLPAEQMAEWVEETVARIRALQPQQIVEIGCGTGLLLFRLAPHCRSYSATDASSEAITYVRQAIAGNEAFDHVRLACRAAHETGDFPASSADVVILNSVVQYFPGVAYLADVLKKAASIVRPGGTIFLGDVRNFALLHAFHTSVALSHAPDTLPTTRLQEQVRARILRESELVIDPAFFQALRQEVPTISHVDIQLKRGRHDNELTRYRYDVTLWIQAQEPPPGKRMVLDWSQGTGSLSALQHVLQEQHPDVLIVNNAPNARLQRDAVIQTILAAEQQPETVAELRLMVERMLTYEGEHLEDFWVAGEKAGYTVSINYAASGDMSTCDMMFRRKTLAAGPWALSERDLHQAGETQQRWFDYANSPLQNQQVRYLVPTLRRYLSQQLPEYMVPAAFVFLDALPLTSNGKVDRRALPAPVHLRPELGQEFVAASNEIEELLAGIWAEVLGLERVGIHDDFFELGGHSLLATQVITRVRQAFGFDIPLRALFEGPTVAQLAEAVETARQARQVDPRPELLPVPHDRDIPLSFAQQRLWVIDQLGTAGGAAYTMVAAARFDGDLNLAAFEASLQRIVQRHEILRTRFVTRQEQVVQVVQEKVLLPLIQRDLSHLAEQAREQEIRELIEREAHLPFDLSSDVLLRLFLLRLTSQQHIFVLITHHIIADGWSVGVFLRELIELYEAFIQHREPQLPALPIHYRDYSAWQRAWLQGERLERQLRYWREQLRGAPARIALPIERTRPAHQTYRGAHYHFTIPPLLCRQLEELSRREEVTLFVTLLAAFNVLLARYAGQEDIVVGSPIANRTHVALENLIGFFVNTLALRTNLAGNPRFRELLRRVQHTALDAYTHQEVPFEMVVEALQPERSANQTPLFQVFFALQNALLPALDLPGLKVTPLDVESGTVKFDLTLTLLQTHEEISGELGYNLDLLSQKTVEHMVERYLLLLQAVVADSDWRIQDIPLLTPEEQRRFQEPAEPKALTPVLSIGERFLEQVKHQPEQIAIVDGSRRISYDDLNQRANQLAHHLRSLGIGAEKRVALFLERSWEAVMALLAVFKAGGVFVPLDIDAPVERLSLILSEAQPEVIVTRDALKHILPESQQARALCLDALPVESKSPGEPTVRIDENQAAYIIYTSGSTGQPKGVVNLYGALARACASWNHVYHLDELKPVLLQQANLAFDVFIEDCIRGLCFGGRLVLCPRQIQLVPGALYQVMQQEAITVAEFVPAVLRQLVRYLEESGQTLSQLELLIIGAESWRGEERRRIRRVLGGQTRIINSYGVTEATIDNMWFDCTTLPLVEERFVPLGEPFENVRAWVLDPQLRPLPVYTVGELYLGGSALARGYLGRADLTAERFLPNPWSSRPGARLYRTGDLARYLPDGSIEYVGRADDQMKVRGLRIEPGEIEAMLRTHPAVEWCLVLPQEHNGEKQIVAYIMGSADEALSPELLHTYLRSRLPDSLVPAHFIHLDSLPLLPNGKVDRRALPRPSFKAGDEHTAQERPGTELETFLAGLWQELLDCERPGLHETFFALGGDSIKAAILANRLQDRLGVDLYAVALFDAPTIAGLAHYLGTHYPAAIERQFGRSSLPSDKSTPAAPQIEKVDAAALALFQHLVPSPPPAASRNKNPQACFILAPPRSGTTLLRVMLAGHPGLFAPPELALLPFNTLEERRKTYEGRNSFWLEGTIRALMEVEQCGVDAARELMAQAERQHMSVQDFYRQVQQRLGERILVDKTTTYALSLATMQRAEAMFEQPRYIHLVRHPQAMIQSFVEKKMDQVYLQQTHPFSARALAELVWDVCHQNILEFARTLPASRYHRISFEDLVAHPQSVMEELSRFLEIEFHPDMIAPYKGQRMTDGIYPVSTMLGDVHFHRHTAIDPVVATRWQQQEEPEPLSEITRALMHELGYQPGEAGTEQAHHPLLPGQFPARAARETYPLSFAQERLWFLDQLAPGSTSYNMPTAVRLRGDLQIEALQRSLETIVRRHGALRTTFPLVDGQPAQRIADAPSITFEKVDVGDQREAEQEVRRIAALEAATPFNLQQGPLLRVRLLCLAHEEFVLLLNIHHIVSDGWSMGVLLRELAGFYTAYTGSDHASPPPAPLQYADFALWQRQQLQGAKREKLLTYWRQQLAGAPVSLHLPTDRPRPAIQSFQGAHHIVLLPAALTTAIKQLSRRQDVTLFTTLLAAFTTLLMRQSGQEDMLVGSPFACRTHTALEDVIGFFVNTLPLRTNLSGSPTFSELLGRVQQAVLGASAHQELPFEQIVKELAPERHLAQMPLFQVVFVLQNAPMPELSLGRIRLEPLEIENQTTKFDLTLAMTETESGLRGVVEYSTDLFDATTIQRFAGQFITLLEQVVLHPEQRITQIPLLSPRERQQMVAGTARRQFARLQKAGLQELFERQAERTPGALAVVDEQEQLTYQELNQRANQLAHHLQASGVGPDVCVGLCVERSIDIVVGILGILKAGGAYVPLDPRYPAARLASILEDIHTPVVVTQAQVRRLLPEYHGQCVCLDVDRELIARQSTINPVSGVSDHNLAYIIYTSGSTGRPKGVMVSHAQVKRLFSSTHPWFGFNSQDVWTLFHSYAFDFSVWELWGALLYGGKLVIVPHLVGRSPAAFYELLRRHQVTVLNQTPSAFYQLMPVILAEQEPALALRLVIFGGEALQTQRLKPWFEHLGDQRPQLVNMYGITETTVHVTYRPLAAEDTEHGRSVIGVPLPDLDLYVLDQQGEPVPIGVTGELYVGGAGVSRGYLNRSDLTAQRFLPDPFSAAQGARMYKTGDVVRCLPDGDIEYLGRNDQQVKIRGFRIEPGEVEAALRQHPLVNESVVVARNSPPDEKKLVAYLVPNAQALDEQGEMVQELREEQSRHWNEVFDETYRLSERDTDFNIIGWNSKYTGQAIPEEQMREWVEGTVEEILRVRPRNVLEIGCGTGLILLRVAPNCERYLGVDPSRQALDYVQRQIEAARERLKQVTLRHGTAMLSNGEAGQAYDTAILNSVVQYFPDIEYLYSVIKTLSALIQPGGCLFIGDVRSLPLLPALYTAVELHHANPSMLCAHLQQRVLRRMLQEEELVIDPAFFRMLPEWLPRISRVDVLLKRGKHWNELTQFRYDVRLWINDGGQATKEEETRFQIEWQPSFSVEACRSLLPQHPEECLLIKDVANARVQKEVAWCTLLERSQQQPGQRVQELLAAAEMLVNPAAIDPQDFWRLEEDLPVRVEIHCAQNGKEDRYNVLIRRQPDRFAISSSPSPMDRSEGSLAQEETIRSGEPARKDLQRYANNPLRNQSMRYLIPTLRRYLHENLPDYCVPAEFVVIERIPLTAHGKIDLAALPEPENRRPEIEAAFVKPSTPLQQTLATIWADLLGIERVGLYDNFFDLGGHSLLATRVIAHIQDVLKQEIPLRCLFEQPTVAGLAALLEEQQIQSHRSDDWRILPAPRSGELPLSFAQERLWFLEQLEPGRSTYTIPSAVRLTGPLNREVLERSLHEIIHRHEVLRATFEERAGRPVQRIAGQLTLPLPVRDLTGLPEGERENEAIRLGEEELGRPFHLTRGPLLRALLVRVQETEHLLFLAMHHIVSDGWSMGVLVEEMAACYTAFLAGQPSPLPALPIQYLDYAIWQRNASRAALFERQLDYWKEHLAGAPPLLALPTDYPRAPLAQRRGGSVALALPETLSNQLREFCQRENVTLFMALFAALNILLYRYSGQDDLVVGSLIAGRTQMELERLIGLFVNTQALRTDLSGNPSVRELLRRVREVALAAYANQDVPFEKVVEALNPARSLATTPLFQVLFVLQNAPMPALHLPGVSLTPLQAEHKSAKFDLLLSMHEEGTTITGEMEYDASLFARATIEQLLAHLQSILEAMIAHPEQRLLEIPLLRREEREQLVQLARGEQRTLPRDLCIHDLIEAQAARTPEAVAGIDMQRQISYQELHSRATRLAAFLRRQGIRAERTVGVCAERDVSLLIAILAILKAGGTYVPLDPAYPPERLAFLYQDAQMRLVLISDSYRSLLAGLSLPIPLVNLEEALQESEVEQLDVLPRVHPEQIAYIIYTSGSTGLPKGVLIRHSAVVTFLHWVEEVFSREEMSGVAATTSQCFDLSIFELLAPLAVGGTSIVVRDIWQLFDQPPAWPVTLLNTVPSVLSQILTARNLPPGIRVVNLAGEALAIDLVKRIYRHQSVQKVYNLYGPSEDTTYSTWTLIGRVEDADTQPPGIGRPLTNTQGYVLDESMQLMPRGAVGELYLAGDGLARGYFRRPELTAERFVPHPWPDQPGQRLYRTGDRARYRADGSLEYLGRIDQQIKIRGFRIEPGEIEAVLRHHEQVRDAAVVAREEGPEDIRLVAYVVAENAVRTEDLLHFLRRKLPRHLIPSSFVLLDQLPLNAHGKLDRRQLPSPEPGTRARDVAPVAPRTPIEQQLVRLWSALLHSESIGIFDNFFDLGGHSLLATQLVSHIRSTFQIDLPLRTIFEAPTVAEIAEVIVQAQKENKELDDLLAELTELSDEEIRHLFPEDSTRDI